MAKYYVDASILVPLLSKNHKNHKFIKSKVADLLKSGFVLLSNLAIDETWYIIYSLRKDHNRSFSQYTSDFRKLINDFLSIRNVELIRDFDELSILENALSASIKFNLRPRDAFHYAYCYLAEAVIVTKDNDFKETDLKVMLV
jgi:predicted nucleic acid-binding protein